MSVAVDDVIIDTEKGKRRTIEAEVYGPLAVHLNPKMEADQGELFGSPAGGWNVTHIQSGRAIERGIATKAKAVELARLLRGLDWTGKVAEFCERNREAVRSARKTVFGE